jgi:MtrB/PioB family decaheme-associated outer membrane protein
MGTWQSCVEANMGQARRLAGVALFTLTAACLSGAVPAPARAEEEALGWKVNGAVDVGGMYRFGTNLGSPKLNNYRDMDNGFLGELELKGEKKDSPYFFELYAKNPATDDQRYEGAFGRYGMFRLDLEWDRTPVVLSNSGQTIYQLNGDTSNLPPAQWAGIVATYNAALAPLTLPLTPVVAGRVAAIQNTVNGLLRPVSLGYNTDVARAGFKYTPTENLRFDLEYSNIRREGRRAIGSVIGSPGGSVNELAIPIENYTNEVKFGAEYARQDWGFQFNYTGSFFDNNFKGYSWDNPVANTNTATATASDRISAAPDNSANTFSLTGTASLPLRSRINGTFAYTMLRQNQTFNQNTLNPALTQRNFDDAGSSSADAQANLIMGNVVLTSRPLDSVTATARYRYFDYQNETPAHTFSFMYPTGQGPAPESDQTGKERYTKQNAGIDLGWRPVRWCPSRAGMSTNTGTEETTKINPSRTARTSASSRWM